MKHHGWRVKVLKGQGYILKFCLVLSAFLVFVTTPATLLCAPKSELEMKAVCILNFPVFVEWPGTAMSGTNNFLNICVLGGNPIFTVLDSLKEKECGVKMVKIRTVTETKELSACHILFIGSSDASQITPLLNQLMNKPVLTISDHESFDKNGGIIRFYIRDNVVKFKINNEAAKKAGLTISSQLLELAGGE
ncbi:MAG: YfiR family protein [Nitrospirae bacterium YQR-1]